MNRIFVKYVTALMLVVVFLACNTIPEQEVNIVPRPQYMVQEKGTFSFTGNTVFAVENEEQAVVARHMVELFTASAGFTPRVEVGAKGEVCFVTDTSLEEEAYILNVTSQGINIKAATIKGFFYALQTLRLSLPASIDGTSVMNSSWTVPAMNVTDAPRFAYRGLMLDVARYFMPQAEVKRVIDCMAMLKLNKLHLHLSDDTGWRLEIKRYPRLTEIGAWRVDRDSLPFYERRNQQVGEKATAGGFYTQEEMKDLINYATEHQIEIIPEIDVPAHSCAALAAYPELVCPVVKVPVTVLPGLGGKNTEIIYCAGNEKTFEFLQGVLDEVIALFPSRYIHMGGDEAAKTYWKQCPLCHKRMLDNGLKDEEELQGYFMSRINEYIRSKGKVMMGWDELTNAEVPEGTVVFGWQGFGNAALKAAAKGHPFVMTPARVLYLIRYQGPQWFEPLTYFGNNTLSDVYTYEPVQENWKLEYESLLMGVQASMWTEFCHSPQDVTYQLFPRLAALAETAWSPKGSKDWEAFLKGLDNYLAHLDAKGVVYATSMYNIQHKVTACEGRLSVKLTCERPDVVIRYTTDGAEPSENVTSFPDSLLVDEAMVLKCATFKGGKRMGELLTLPLLHNKATGKPVLDENPQVALLTNGVRGSLRQSDFEWCTWSKLDKSSFTVDMLQSEQIQRVKVGCLTNYGMAVHKPEMLTVEVSEDNRIFEKVGERQFRKEEIFQEGNFVEDIVFDFPVRQARYVRVTLNGAEACPSEHFMRPGQPARYYLDEVIIE